MRSMTDLAVSDGGVSTPSKPCQGNTEALEARLTLMLAEAMAPTMARRVIDSRMGV